MIRLIVPVLISLFATSAFAAAPCTIENGNCAPVVGCFGADRLYFEGQLTGKKDVTLSVKTRNRATCTASWRRGASVQSGLKVTCSDGRTARVRYTDVDPASGTGFARGRTDQKEMLRFWTGHRLNVFFMLYPKQLDGIVACGRASKR